VHEVAQAAPVQFSTQRKFRACVAPGERAHLAAHRVARGKGLPPPFRHRL